MSANNDFDYYDEFIGHPLPGSKEVRVSSEMRRGFGAFRGKTIPIDLRSYILFADTILRNGVKVMTHFEIDTRKPTLLVSEGVWYIGRRWYRAFLPESLERLGVRNEEARPFSWVPYVPILTVEQPPYQEGLPLHAQALPELEKAASRPNSGAKVGGGLLKTIDLQVGEKLLWSFDARRPSAVVNGKLCFTTQRAFFCPPTKDGSAEILPFMAGRRELFDAGCKSVEVPGSPTGRRMCLQLVLVGGRDEIFVVDDVVQLIEVVATWIHPVN